MQSLAPGGTDLSVETLIGELASKLPQFRERARRALVAIKSSEVSAALSAALASPLKQVRWEAAKAMVSLADADAAPALVRALDDENEDVRWLAREALIVLGPSGVMVVLKAVMASAKSPRLCEGAYRVLRATDCGPTALLLAPVLAALHDTDPSLAAPPAAYKARLELETLLNAKQAAPRIEHIPMWDD